jgi:PAS domain S-box-containing protein
MVENPPPVVGVFPDEYSGAQSTTSDEDETLKATLDHYNAIINSTGDAMIRKSLDGIIVGWNRGAEIIFGYTRAEMVGQSIQRILPNDRLFEEVQVITRVGHGEGVKPFDTVRLRKDGNIVHVSVSISPISDDLGNITGFSTIARDITERVRLEEALIARERELYHLAESMPQIVWVTRADGWNIYFNQQWVNYTGLTLDESYGHGWNKPFHLDDRKRAWDAWQNAVNHGGAYSLECRLRRADGVYQWWLVRGVPFSDETGKVIRWHGTCTDIQDIKQAEFEIEQTRQTLAESEARFRGAFETAAHGMALVSTKGHFIKVNQALCDMLGYTSAELLQAQFQDITHPDDLENDLAYVEALLEGSINNYDMEKRYFHKNGGIVWALLSVSLVRSSTGDPVHFVSQIQNISKRRAAEQMLQEAKTEAEIANHAKSDFLASMSHELRTPLNAVIGFAQMLELNLPQNLTASQTEYIRYIINGGNHLLDLVNEVLDLAGIESGRLHMSIEPLRVHDVLGNVFTSMSPLATKAGLIFEVPDAAEVGDVLADNLRLRQVLINLVSNAIKYNRPGGAVKLTATRMPGGAVRFAVADTGVGIAQDRQKEVFKPFERLGAEHTSIEGTGIGLALSRRIVEAMNGTIGFSSDVGIGSEFWVELPEASAEDTGPLLLLPSTAPRAAAGGFSLLHIEDNPSNLRLVERIVSTLPDVAILMAQTPQLGLEMAVAHRPDVIVLDLNLPEINGYEVLARLRSRPETCDIPVVALSAAAFPNDVKKGLAAGFFRYLTKPLDLGAFLDAVQDALAEATGRRSAKQ